MIMLILISAILFIIAIIILCYSSLKYKHNSHYRYIMTSCFGANNHYHKYLLRFNYDTGCYEAACGEHYIWYPLNDFELNKIDEQCYDGLYFKDEYVLNSYKFYKFDKYSKFKNILIYIFAVLIIILCFSFGLIFPNDGDESYIEDEISKCYNLNR